MNDTIAALATPHGESAIAIMRMSGCLSKELLGGIFRRTAFLHGKMYHGSYASVCGNVIDDVMFVFFNGSASYTGEDSAEIHSHGNMIIVSSILVDLCARGCRLADRGEFTRRAFLNGKLDLCQAEAVVDVIHSSSEAALAISQTQLSGKLSEKLYAIDDSLMNILALLETHIDFIEDELENNHFDGVTIHILHGIVAAIDHLLDTHKYHSVLRGGANVAIIGAPNAGKSSLMNLMLHSERALVSAEAGTTRDFITEKLMVGGQLINLFDTAGLRDKFQSEIEGKGIAKSIEQIKHANAYLFVLDSSEQFPKISHEVRCLLTEKNCLVLENKSDLANSIHCDKFMPNFKHFRCSIIDGNSNLLVEISKFLSGNCFLPNEVEVVVNSRHVDILARVKKNILESSSALTNGEVEFAAEDIKNALETLGEITGRYDNEQMLDKLFSTFCIGK